MTGFANIGKTHCSFSVDANNYKVDDVKLKTTGQGPTQVLTVKGQTSHKKAPIEGGKEKKNTNLA